mgnify:CR=1 FL=1
MVEESLLNEQKLPNKVAHKEMHLVNFTTHCCEESIRVENLLQENRTLPIWPCQFVKINQIGLKQIMMMRSSFKMSFMAYYVVVMINAI